MDYPPNRMYDDTLRHLSRSIHAEQIFCSITTEMKYMDSFKNQIGMKMVHRENYETSYHRNTAAGNLKRIISGAGPSERQLLRMTVECFMEADEHDQNIEDALQTIEVRSSHDQAWMDAARSWHRRRRDELARASHILKVSIPDELWKQGESMAE